MDTVLFIEIATSMILGIALIVFSCRLIKIKGKGFLGIILNAVMGCLLLFLFNLFGLTALPVNPLNAFICAVFGIFGIILLYLIITFL